MASVNPANIPPVAEPLPIFKLAHRYLLYDPPTIAYVREKYNICGVLIGGLPQAPQQNVFSGVPLELMPEEARLILEKRVAFIVDDVAAHKQGFLGDTGLSAEEKRAYQAALKKQGQAAATQANKRTDDRKKAALSRKVVDGDWNDIPEDMLRPSSRSSSRAPKRKGKTSRDASRQNIQAEGNPVSTAVNGISGDESEVLFPPSSKQLPPRPPELSRPPSHANSNRPEPYAVTPTTSYPPLKPPPTESTPADDSPNLTVTPPSDLPDVPPSYPLFKHLHKNGYFLSPGLRFGCQYMAYPGDPLRFHSHFLCNGMDWDQEFNLLDLVGGGRLGTGVKKGFLLGGEEKQDVIENPDSDDPKVRTFCIEWGGM